MINDHYFAYGSNMNPERMSQRCPQATFEGIAELADHAVRIGHRGVATLVPTPGASAHGVLWALTDGDVPRLDHAEGVKLGLYRRAHPQVITGKHTATVLTYVEDFIEDGLPRPGYLEIILKGAKHFRLPEWYIDTLAGLAAKRSDA